jgi:hypothetical protein
MMSVNKESPHKHVEVNAGTFKGRNPSFQLCDLQLLLLQRKLQLSGAPLFVGTRLVHHTLGPHSKSQRRDSFLSIQ